MFSVVFGLVIGRELAGIKRAAYHVARWLIDNLRGEPFWRSSTCRRRQPRDILWRFVVDPKIPTWRVSDGDVAAHDVSGGAEVFSRMAKNALSNLWEGRRDGRVDASLVLFSSLLNDVACLRRWIKKRADGFSVVPEKRRVW